MSGRDGWRRVNRSSPCPVCGKGDACKVSTDDAIVMCKRVEQGAFKTCKGGWYLHKLNSSANRNSRHDTPSGTGWKPDPCGSNGIAKGRTQHPTPEAAMTAAAKTIEGGGRFVRAWAYHDVEGTEVMRVGRWDTSDGKVFRPIHRSKSGWKLGDPQGPLPLYHLPDLSQGDPVYVCEGEKAVDAATKLGLTATTSAHGAESADRTDWRPLSGREVVILPDNDPAGEKYARSVARLLVRLDPPARVRIARLPDLPPGGDIVEFVDARRGDHPESIGAEVEVLAQGAVPLDPTELIGGPMMTCLADVEPESVEWLCPNVIARGKLNLVCGDPGAGKSTLTLHMAAVVSTGSPWMVDPITPSKRGAVILISAEDGMGDTIRPRLDAAGADVSRVVALQGSKIITDEGKTVIHAFTLADLPTLDAALRRTPGVLLVIIDPVSAYLADADSHKNAEIRGLLAPLAQLAERHNVAVVLVTHLSKGVSGKAMYRAMGSLAFIAAARTAWLVAEDRQDARRRLLLPIKNNLAENQTGYAYRVIDKAVRWEDEPLAMRADEALGEENGNRTAKPGPAPKARSAATEWLRELLADGPMRVGDPKQPEPGTVAHATKEAGLSWGGAVRRAREDLGIKPYKGHFGDGWYWRLPHESAQDGEQPLQTQITCASSGKPAHLGVFDPENTAFSRGRSPSTRGGCASSRGPLSAKNLWPPADEGAQDARVSLGAAGEGAA